MNIACVEKSGLSILNSIWHEHPLTPLTRKISLSCNLCAMADSSSPSYMCPPCGFLVHQGCLNLPRVIRISRHPHCLSFTFSFNKGVWSCGVCRKGIDNDYGGYSCIEDGCSYMAHLKCATQRNVWDGIELEGKPEEIEEEELEPFVRVRDEIIQHFSHQQHHLRLDENTGKEHDENKQCQLCSRPINFDKFYSCMQCNFILHENCANLPLKLHSVMHPHRLTLVGGYAGAIDFDEKCSACRLVCTSGLFYECGEEGCGGFKLHVQCATILEPLVHESHMHPLFLTSKPGEERRCEVCRLCALETFNCIEDYCGFALCFRCATSPHKVKYKDDRHTHSKWHKHRVTLFPRQVSLPCNLCALTHLSWPLYICPPCNFVVHQNCLNLPHVIRISRHPHRLSFTFSFDKGVWSCGVCRKGIENDYGGYSCITDGCSYVAHSKCATQRNVWDGIELEGKPEEIEEEELEPFVRIRDEIIQHFSHQQHHLKLDENKNRDYDENKQCQVCITPIYSGNIYSCTQCDFLLHGKCTNLSRKLHHPIHPHMLTLVGGYDGVMDYRKDRCSACRLVCTNGFFYQCSKEECGRFKLHVQCATISEPFVHESHMHPLFLISKPGDQRTCGVCKESRILSTGEILSCMDCEFALCFACATIPHHVRYTDDRHILTLCYGKEASTKTFWCEECEQKINPKERFYKCDEYCCVTIHMECLIGKDLHMKPGLLLRDNNKGIDIKVMSNNHHIARPFCSGCKKRCPQKIMFESSGLVFCSLFCVEEDSELNSMGDDLSTSSFTM